MTGQFVWYRSFIAYREWTWTLFCFLCNAHTSQHSNCRRVSVWRTVSASISIHFRSSFADAFSPRAHLAAFPVPLPA